MKRRASNLVKMRNPKESDNRRRIKKTEFEEYAHFLALPSYEREEVYGFHLDSDFAVKFRVSKDSLTDWKDDDRLWELRNKHMKRFKRYTPDIYMALGKGAIERKSASEVMAWAKLVEGWKESVKTEGGVKVGFEEEFEEQIEAIIQLLDTAGERASQNPVNSNRKAKTG